MNGMTIRHPEDIGTAAELLEYAARRAASGNLNHSETLSDRKRREMAVHDESQRIGERIPAHQDPFALHALACLLYLRPSGL